MYAIYGNMDPIFYHQYTPVMLAYIPYMDPMGNVDLPSGERLHSYWKCPFIDFFPIKNDDFP